MIHLYVSNNNNNNEIIKMNISIHNCKMESSLIKESPNKYLKFFPTENTMNIYVMFRKW